MIDKLTDLDIWSAPQAPSPRTSTPMVEHHDACGSEFTAYVLRSEIIILGSSKSELRPRTHEFSQIIHASVPN